MEQLRKRWLIKGLINIVVIQFLFPQVGFAQRQVVHYPTSQKTDIQTPVTSDRIQIDDQAIYRSELKTLQIKEEKEQIFLDKGKAIVIRHPEPIKRAAIADPAIADIVVLNTEEIMVNAKDQGATNLIIWNEAGVYNNYDIIIGVDYSKLEDIINNVIGEKGNVRVFDSKDGIVLNGEVEDMATFEKVEKISQSYIADQANSTIVNFVTINKNEQILLEVRFIEVNITKTRKRGIDLQVLLKNVSAYSFVGQTGAAPNPNTPATVPGGSITADTLTVNQNSGEFDLAWASGSQFSNAIIDDLKSEGIFKVIANPNLIAQNREEASFLVGGEFPVVSVSDTVFNTEFKEFGIQLNFLPEITERGTIRLQIAPEVSQLDFTKAAVTVNSSTIPGVTTRKTDTTVELEAGKSLVISGLLSKIENDTSRTSSPFAYIPVIGKFFSTVNYTGEEIELLILVTPHLIGSMDLGEKKKFFDTEQMQKVIHLSHLDLPHEQANEMKKVIAQADELSEKEGIALTKEVVRRNRDEEVSDDKVKLAEAEMIVLLEEREKEKEDAEREKVRQEKLAAKEKRKAEREAARQEKLVARAKRKAERKQARQEKAVAKTKQEAEREKQLQEEMAREAERKAERLRQKELMKQQKLEIEKKKVKKQASEKANKLKESQLTRLAKKEARVEKELQARLVNLEKLNKTRMTEIDREISSRQEEMIHLKRENQESKAEVVLQQIFELERERDTIIEEDKIHQANMNEVYI